MADQLRMLPGNLRAKSWRDGRFPILPQADVHRRMLGMSPRRAADVSPPVAPCVTTPRPARHAPHTMRLTTHSARSTAGRTEDRQPTTAAAAECSSRNRRRELRAFRRATYTWRANGRAGSRSRRPTVRQPPRSAERGQPVGKIRWNTKGRGNGVWQDRVRRACRDGPSRQGRTARLVVRVDRRPARNHRNWLPPATERRRSTLAAHKLPPRNHATLSAQIAGPSKKTAEKARGPRETAKMK
jgi:hypothetical protein